MRRSKRYSGRRYHRRRQSFLLSGIAIKMRTSLANAWNVVKAFFAKILPKRAAGEPIWKSRRAIAACAAAVVCAGVVCLCVFCTPSARPVNAQNTDEQGDVATLGAEGGETQEEPLDLAEGSQGDQVLDLEQRMMAIGYMEEDEPSDQFSQSLTLAVQRFQLLNGKEVTGRVDDALWELIFSETYEPYKLIVGMQGEDIQDLQERLRDLGYTQAEPTGQFDEATQASLLEFQTKNNIEASGVIDEQTSMALYSEDVVANYAGFGDQSEEIKSYQQRLVDLGYMSAEPDGIYGSMTLEAVKLFQKKNDLVIDGYIGYQTKNLLMSDQAQRNAFTIGDESQEVMRLQNRLVNLGYISKATGYYGTDTETAVKNFQKLNNLSVDGKAGYYTITALFSENPVKATTKVIVGKSSKINNFIAAAKSKLGHRYVLGGKGPNTFDCSGLVYWCLNQAGVKQGYATSVTWRTLGSYETIKDFNKIQAGDIICFSPHHVGIAISNNTMIDASTRNGKVVQRSFRTSYWKSAFVCARRVF